MIEILPSNTPPIEILPYQANITINAGSSANNTLPITPPPNTQPYTLIVLNQGVTELADCTNLDHAYLPIGLLLPDGSIIFEGVVFNPNWNLQPLAPIFLGTNGSFVSVPLNSSVFIRILGSPLTSTQLFFSPEQATLV
jgi:hypothetical protein